MLAVWVSLAISDTPLYGWNFANAPFDTIGVSHPAHVAGGATRELYGVAFAGDPSFIDLPTLTFGGDLTFELLFSGYTQSATLFVCAESDGSNAVNIKFSGTSTVRTWDFTFGEHSFTKNTSALEGWVHVVFTVQGENTPNTVVNMYPLGLESPMVGDPTTAVIPAVSRSNCHLGDTFQGEIRAFNVYDEVLSQSDVTAAYDKAIPFNATKLVGWDFKTLSYPEYANPNFAGCPHDSAWTFTNSTSAICSPHSTEHHSDDFCLHPPYPRDFNDLPLPLGSLSPDNWRCVMKCGGDATCPSKGASECMSVPNNDVIPPFQVLICMHPDTQGVYYATETTLRSTQLPSPVVTVDGTYDEQRGITGVGTYVQGVSFSDGMSIEMQVYMDDTYSAGDLLDCGESGSRRFKLSIQDTFCSSCASGLPGYRRNIDWTSWDSGGSRHDVSIQNNLAGSPGIRVHLVVTVAKDGTTTFYYDGSWWHTGQGGVPTGTYQSCLITESVHATLSSLSIYEGVMEEDEVHEAFHHCSEEPAPPTPAPDGVPASTEEQGMSASTGIAIFAAAFVYVGLTAALVATCTVAAFGHVKRN